jgi:hypothetical protein
MCICLLQQQQQQQPKRETHSCGTTLQKKIQSPFNQSFLFSLPEIFSFVATTHTHAINCVI